MPTKMIQFLDRIAGVTGVTIRRPYKSYEMPISQKCSAVTNSQLSIFQNYLKRKIITLGSINKKKIYKFVKIFTNNDWIEIIKNIIKTRNDFQNMLSKCESGTNILLALDYKKELHICIASDLNNDNTSN